MAANKATKSLPGAVGIGSGGGIIRLDDVTNTQGRTIPDATPKNSGVMTKLQAAQLAALVAGGGGGAGATNFNVVKTVGPTYDANYNDLVEADTTANAIVVNLPRASTVSPSHGNVLVVKNVGTNQSNLVRVNPSLGDSVDGRAAINTVLADGETMYLVSDGVSNFIVIVIPTGAGVYNVRMFGAIGDGTSHPLSDFFSTLAAAQVVYPFATSLTNEIDWAATQLAVNLAASGVVTPTQDAIGGTVNIPKGVFLYDQPIASHTNVGVLLSGVGHGFVGTGNDHDGASVLVYTGVGTGRFLDFRSSFGCIVEKLSIIYSNPGFLGDLVDFSHFNGSDTQGGVVRDCCLSGGLAVNIVLGQGCRSLVYLNNAIECTVDSNLFIVALQGIRFRDGDASYSNSHNVTDNQFLFHNYSMVNGGENTYVAGNTFEGTGGQLFAAYFDDYTNVTVTPARTFTFDAVAKTITCDTGSFITDGWVIGQSVSCFELFAGVNTTTFDTPLSNVTANVLTIAGTTNMVSEVRHTDCKLYGTSVVPDVASPTSEATLGVVVTIDAATSTLTRDNGSWLDDKVFVGETLNIQGSVSNDGGYSPVTGVTAKVVSFEADTITFAGGGDTITRSSGSFVDDGWAVGMQLQVSGTNFNNNGGAVWGNVSNVAAGVLTVTGAVFVAEASSTANVFSLLETRFQARTQASPGVALVNEVMTSGQIFQSGGGGPITWIANWFGDQFLPSTWMQCAGGACITMIGNQFVGNLRVLEMRQDVTGLNVCGGNHIVTLQEPFKLSAAQGVSIAGNALGSAAADIVVAGSLSNVLMAGNTFPAPGFPADILSINAKSFDLTMASGKGAVISRPDPAGGADGALNIEQDTFFLTLGAITLGALLQSSGPLRINWFGGHTLLNNFGFSNVGVGDGFFDSQLAAGNPTSCLTVGGPLALPYQVMDIDTPVDNTGGRCGIDATTRNVTATLPDATTCKGRQYTFKRIDDTLAGFTAAVATVAGQTFDGAASPYPLAAQWATVTIWSDGANWLIESKI